MNFPKVSLDTKWFIYLLVDPRVMSGYACDEVRYVGFSVDVRSRLVEHVKAALSGCYNSRCSRWIRCLIDEDHEPLMRVVDSGSGASWRDAERFWICFIVRRLVLTSRI